MLDKFLTKPLTLRVGDKTLKFSSETDFEFSMAGRTAIPSSKISNLLLLPVDQLKKEEDAVSKIKDSFFAILTQSIEQPDTIERSMRELDTKLFSQDHNWRDIIKGLNENNAQLNPLRMIALSKYFRYLTALHETIGYIRATKESAGGNAAAEDEDDHPEFGATWGPGHMPVAMLKSVQNANEFERLPKGEAVRISLAPGTEMGLKLAEYVCRLVRSEDRILFFDHAGKKHVLELGRNVLGRGSKSIVKIDSALREISRTHVVIHNEDNQTIELTDLSAGGTFISSRDLKYRVS